MRIWVGSFIAGQRSEGSVRYPVNPPAAVGDVRALDLQNQQVLAFGRPFCRRMVPSLVPRIDAAELPGRDVEQRDLALGAMTEIQRPAGDQSAPDPAVSFFVCPL